MDKQKLKKMYQDNLNSPIYSKKAYFFSETETFYCKSSII